MKALNQVQGSGLHPRGQNQLTEHRVHLGVRGRASRGGGALGSTGEPKRGPKLHPGAQTPRGLAVFRAVEDPESSPRGVGEMVEELGEPLGGQSPAAACPVGPGS